MAERPIPPDQLEAASRAVLAEFFGGPKYGTPPDGQTVNSHIEQNTPEWRRAQHYARVALSSALEVASD